MLFMAYEGQQVSAIRRRHGPALQALYHLIHDLVSHPAVFTELGFSAEQTAAARQLLGRFAGSASRVHCAPDTADFRRQAARRVLEEALFMVLLFFLLLSRDFPALALAECLEGARFGFL